MAENVAAAAIVEVEIGVVGKVAQRRLVGRRGELDRQCAGNFQAVGAGDVDRAGKAHVAIGRMQRQGDEIVAMQRDVPDALAKTLGAAMQRVLAEEVGVGLVCRPAMVKRPPAMRLA